MPVAKTKRFAHTGRRPNDDRRQAVLALYQSGLSIHAVSALIGVSPQAVHSMLQRMGAQLRPRGGNRGSHSRHRK